MKYLDVSFTSTHVPKSIKVAPVSLCTEIWITHQVAVQWVYVAECKEGLICVPPVYSLVKKNKEVSDRWKYIWKTLYFQLLTHLILVVDIKRTCKTSRKVSTRYTIKKDAC